jgi:hypothetical protein
MNFERNAFLDSPKGFPYPFSRNTATDWIKVRDEIMHRRPDVVGIHELTLIHRCVSSSPREATTDPYPISLLNVQAI